MFQMEALNATARPAAMRMRGVALMSTSLTVPHVGERAFHMAVNASDGIITAKKEDRAR